MGRKIITSIAILAFLACIAVGYFTLKSKNKVENVDAFHAIPSSAYCLARVNSFDHVGQILSYFPSKEAAAILGCVAMIPDENQKTSSLFVSSHPSTSEGSTLLYLLSFSAESVASKLYQQLTSTFGKTINQRAASELQFPDGTRLYIQQLQRFIALSATSLLVEEAASQWNGNSSLPIEDLAFAQAVSTSGRNANANLFFSNSMLRAMSERIVTPATNGLFNLFSDLQPSGWMALDANVQGELCILSGFWVTDSSSPVFSVLLDKNSKGVELSLLKHIPENAALVTAYSTSNVDSLLSQYGTFLSSQSLLNDYNRRLSMLSDSCNVNLRHFFTSLVPHEVAFVALPASGGKSSYLSVAKLASGEVATQKMGMLKGTENPIKGCIAALFGGLFALNNESSYTIVENALLISDSKSLLEELKGGKKNLLSADNAALTQYLSDDCKALIYMRLPNGTMHAPYGFSFGKRAILQLSAAKNGMLYCNAIATVDKKATVVPSSLVTAEAAKEEEKPQSAGEVVKPKAEKPSSKAPLISQTLLVSGTEYAIKQDNDFLLEITPKGEPPLKIKLDEEVRGFNRVQLSANGDICWAFNSDSKIYMFDSKGKLAKGFPIKLKAKATNDIAVYDYGNTRDYRIFVACSDKNIYLFDKNGNKVEGWNPKPVKSTVSSPVRFFRVAGKDYLLVADEEKVYILDRKGNERVKVKEDVATAKNSSFSADDNPPRISCTDTKGRKVTIYLSNGKVERK